MYAPVSDGFSKRAPAIRYVESAPPRELAEVVHCFWELRTLEPLAEDFQYHALPDACVNLLLNQVDPAIAGVTALHTSSTVLNLGRSFHYVGVQLFPGVWRAAGEDVVDHYVGTPYRGALPLVRTSERLVGLDFHDMRSVLLELVQWCLEHGHVAPNAVTSRILSRLDEIRSVADMASLVGLSARQLQRTLKQSTGFAPHDLLKVLRVQQSFRTHYLDLYADQAHFIHSFRNATGLTPVQYRKRFGV
jgi:AraC-like DNA-binding protein